MVVDIFPPTWQHRPKMVGGCALAQNFFSMFVGDTKIQALVERRAMSRYLCESIEDDEILHPSLMHLGGGRRPRYYNVSMEFNFPDFPMDAEDVSISDYRFSVKFTSRERLRKTPVKQKPTARHAVRSPM